MKRIIIFLLVEQLLQPCIAQQNVAINSTGAAPHASAQLDISSLNKGILIPRMNSMQRGTITSPATGLLVFDTDTNSFWFYNGTTWTNLTASSGGWSVTGNNGTNPTTNYIGTSDNADLRFKINTVNAGFLSSNGNIFWGLRSGNNNSTAYSTIAIGIDALKINTTRSNIVAIGDSALFNNGAGVTQSDQAINNIAIGSKSLFANTTGSYNTAHGTQTLYSNSIGNYNTGGGFQSLFSNTTGSWNSAYGLQALFSNTTGNYNTAIAVDALRANTTGDFNTAIGYRSLYSNTTGIWNTANGFGALYANTTGNYNTASGLEALRTNSAGSWNTANGLQSLYFNTTGNYNTATAVDALHKNVTGQYNTATGYQSLYNNTSGNWNTAHGLQALFSNTIGSTNTAQGVQALYSNTTGFSNVAVGPQALFKNTTGWWLVAIGDSALYNNVAVGPGSFDGYGNTAIGSKALYTNTIGYYNSAIGYNALISNSTGYENTAHGVYALYSTSTGDRNTAMGAQTLVVNTTGNYNSAFGSGALNNSSGDGNTAMGTAALQTNLTGTYNTAIGYVAVVGSGSLTNATAIGARARVDCDNCMVLGSINGVNSATSNVKVGIGTTTPQQLLSVSGAMNVDQDNANNGTGVNPGLTFGSGSGEGIASKRNAGGNQFGLDFYTNFLNRMSITPGGNIGIGTNNPQSMLHLGNGGVLKINDGSGTRYVQLFHSNTGNVHLDAFGGGTNYISWYGGSGLHVGNGTAGGYGPVNASAFVISSSILYKKEIVNIHYGLAEVLQLQGKEYKYIRDSTNRKEIGLIAEEVEKILPEVVYRNSPDKEITGIDYGKLTPVLIEAVKELQKQIEELKKENAEIKSLLNKNK